jgi:feruloyl esterase
MSLRLATMMLLMAAAVPAAAQAPDSCRGLLTRSFANLQDAATTLTAAVPVPAADGVPEHCAVRGYIAPQVNFELQMPVSSSWNGRFLMQGCGGLCGSSQPATCEDALARNYATVVTDMGHSGQAWQALWAYNNVPSEIDFAYRATHVVAVAAKAIITAYYERPAKRSYFRGCSTGGRQGLGRRSALTSTASSGAPVFDETGMRRYPSGAGAPTWTQRAGRSCRPLTFSCCAQLAAMLAMASPTASSSPYRCGWDPQTLLCDDVQAGA